MVIGLLGTTGVEAVSYTHLIHALNQHIEEFPGMRLHLLDEVYPMGDEVVLIYEATGRVVRPLSLIHI